MARGGYHEINHHREDNREVRRNVWSFWITAQLVSNNGPQLVSQEMTGFLQANGVQHIKSAPYHPATNGLAERFVQTMKHALKT